MAGWNLGTGILRAVTFCDRSHVMKVPKWEAAIIVFHPLLMSNGVIVLRRACLGQETFRFLPLISQFIPVDDLGPDSKVQPCVLKVARNRSVHLMLKDLFP